ncbi:SGNH hydrolase domain-containing protein [Macrococcus equipercicus]
MKKIDKKPYLPTAANISDDKALPFTDGCQQNLDSAEVKICEYGATKNYDATVALVGGSHSTHWHSALLKIAEKHNIRLVNMTKAGCRLSTGKEGLPKCDEWNEHIIGKIAEVKPDLVFTTAEISYFNIKEVPQGYIEQFEALNKLGIQVFGVRDTPYFRNHVPRCIEEFGRDSKECAIEKVLVVPDVTDWSKLKNPPANVHYYDYTDHICPDTLCRPVIGNVVGYYDTGHLSVSFVNTLVPYIEEDLIPLLNKVKKK